MIRQSKYVGCGCQAAFADAPAPLLLFFPAVLSQELLAANVEALTTAQGACPPLAAPTDAVRLRAVADGVVLDRRDAAGAWHALDFDDATEASTWLQDVCGDGTRQAIVAGAGLGRSLEAADALGLTRILLIEPDPAVAAVFLSCRDWRPLITSGRLRLLTGPDYRGAADIARFFDGLADIAVVTHPFRTHSEPREAAMATVVGQRIANGARANGEARRKFAGPYLLQTLANLHVIGRSAPVEALDGLFGGVPAIICGAGPSLDTTITELARLQDRAVVIAADTTLGPLTNNGISPHFVVAADSSELNARHLTSVSGSNDVMLVAEGSVHPSTLRMFDGRTFTFRVSDHEPWPWLATAGVTRTELRTWGSVLTSAFDLARRLGCNPIVFTGADLAFTGGRPYCRGTIYDAAWQEWIDKGCTWEQLMADYFSRQPEVWLDDVRGERVRTAPHLVSFRNWLVEQMTTAGERRYINATGGGILHGGAIEQGTLAGVFEGGAPLGDLRARIVGQHAAATAERRDADRIDRLLEEAAADPGRLPLDRWRAFTASTVTAEQLLEVLPATAT